MILVVGGAGSGKGAYLRETLGLDMSLVARATLDGRPCVADVHLLAAELDRRELAPEGLDVRRAAERVAEMLAGKALLTCDETGCSLLPLDPARAREQELAGRLGCLLARRAETVVRLVCGVPSALKGELPAGPLDVRTRAARHAADEEGGGRSRGARP